MALLSWLIRNCPSDQGRSEHRTKSAAKRDLLRNGDPATIVEALRLLRADPRVKGWWILEGQTAPDAYIETPDALIVVEGKRTEPGPTTHTKWMDGRRQIWRHIDAAWEIRGRRQVFGFYIVEGESGGAVPKLWKDEATAALL